MFSTTDPRTKMETVGRELKIRELGCFKLISFGG